MVEGKDREWTRRRRRRRDSPQREGEFQLLGNLGTKGEEPGEGQQDNLSALEVQKNSNPTQV